MSKKEKFFRIWAILKGCGSVVMLVAILLTAGIAIKFCLSLFVNGDYVVILPGEESPVIQGSANAPEQEGPAYVTEVARAKLTLAGDVMLHMPIVNSVSGYDYSEIFRFVGPKVALADYAVADLETTLSGTDEGREYTGSPQFNSPDTITAALQGSGFDMLLTGNNHCYDYGTQGLKRTLEAISSRGLATLGTVSTADAPGHTVKDVAGIKVGMVSYTFGELGENGQPTVNGLATDSTAAGLINVFDYNRLEKFYEEMTAHIAGMETKGAETIVLYIHWGNEYSLEVTEQQKAMAQKLCDLGVDVIVGTHPHAVQPAQLLTSTADPSQKTLCLYSLGTFLSNLRGEKTEQLSTGHTEDSALFTLSFVKYSDGKVYLEGVDALPTWVRVEGSGDGRKYTIIPLEGDSSKWAEAYGLTEAHTSAAAASYNRTTAILGEGMAAVNTALVEEKAIRQPFISVG